jgi:hypothetical protein
MCEPVGAHRDVVTFNSLITELGLFRRWLPALGALCYMVLEGHLLTSFTVVGVLAACSHLVEARTRRWRRAEA